MPIEILTNRSTQNLFAPASANTLPTNLLTANLDTFTPGQDDFKKFEANHPLAARRFNLAMFGNDDPSLTMFWLGLGLITGVDFFATDQTDSMHSTHRLPIQVPVGAIDLVVLKTPMSVERSSYFTLLDGSPPSYTAVSDQGIKIFPTLANLEQLLTDAFGGPVSMKQLRTTTSWQRRMDNLQDMTFWPSKSGNDAHVARYKNAFGDTVVEFSSEDIFDAGRNKAGKSYEAVAHLTGDKKLPAGEYDQYIVRYYFNPDGSYRGITLDKVTIHYHPHQQAGQSDNGCDYIEDVRIAIFDNPGRPIPATMADMFVKAIRATQPAVNPIHIAGGQTVIVEGRNFTEAQLKEAVISSLRNWFSMTPKARRGITRLIGARNGKSPDLLESKDIDRIEPEWVTSRAMAHLEGRGGTLFDVKRTKEGLEVMNASVVFNDHDIYSPYEVFTLGNTGEDFPPEPLIDAVADELQKRVALGNIPRDQFGVAVKRAFAEWEHHRDAVVGPDHEDKGSRPTIPVTVNGRAMELQTDVIEDAVRYFLFTPVKASGQKWASFFRGFFRTRVRLGDAKATEFIPRSQLPEFAMGTDERLREFKTYIELLTAVHSRFGEPDKIVPDFSKWDARWHGVSRCREWAGAVNLYAIKPGHGMKGFIEWIGDSHGYLGQIDFPVGDIEHIAIVSGDIYDSRGNYADIDGRHHPYTAHDVYYFFDSLGNLASAMVVVRSETNGTPSRVALRMDTPAVTGHVSYEQIKFKELVAKATESFRSGKFKEAFDTFARLAYRIEEMSANLKDAPIAKALKRLQAAAHEAAGDMAELADNPKPTHYEMALSLAREVMPEEFASLKARVDEVKGEGGREVIERIWIEMGAAPLFRGPLAALEGGTVTPEEMARSAVDMSPPMFDGAGAAIRTEELLRTRRAILDANRRLLESAKKGRER